MVDERLLVGGVMWGVKPGCEFTIERADGSMPSGRAREALRQAYEHRLEVVKWESSEGWKSVAICVPGVMAGKILRDAKDFFEHLGVAQALDELIQELDTYSVAQAIAKLFGRYEDHKPEIGISLGLLFGFPVCCIRHYVETRHMGKPWEVRDYDVGYVQCDACYALKAKPPWLKLSGFTGRRAGKRFGAPPR